MHVSIVARQLLAITNRRKSEEENIPNSMGKIGAEKAKVKMEKPTNLYHTVRWSHFSGAVMALLQLSTGQTNITRYHSKLHSSSAWQQQAARVKSPAGSLKCLFTYFEFFRQKVQSCSFQRFSNSMV